MRKLIAFLFYVLLGCINLNAQQRSESEAIQIAKEFWGKQSMTSQLSIVPKQKISDRIRKNCVSTRTEPTEISSFYVVNDEENNRFVIVSSDERLITILGYSDNGLFDEETAPEGLIDLLSGYNVQYEQLLSKNFPNTTNKGTRNGGMSISPLIQSKWDQKSPYNLLCPPKKESVTGEKCATGCVATAMAQVMNYYKYPQKCQGGNYEYESQGEKLSLNYDSISFDWDNVQDEYTGVETQGEENAVANLMYACGVSVSTEYGDESSAKYPNVPYAFIHYFGYNANTVYYERAYYKNREWRSIIMDELEGLHPILYSGNGTGLHAFILDGCNEEGKFHFNFGWSGRCDGYYELDVIFILSLDENGLNLHDFSSDHTMVCQIYPTQTGKHEDVFYSKVFNLLSSDREIGNSLIFHWEPVCYSSISTRDENCISTFSGQIGIGLFDEELNYLSSLGIHYVQGWEIGHGYRYKDTIKLSTTNPFLDGKSYYIAPYAKASSSESVTRIRTLNGESDWYFASVEKGIISLTKMGTPPLVVENNEEGMLSSRLNEEKMLTVSNLTITGKINGTDINIIRRMFQEGKLQHLDIGNALIVSGGEAYETNSYPSQHLTEDNIISENMFNGCSQMVSIILPSSITKIEYQAFNECNSLEQINIPAKCTEISNLAFWGCTNLKEINLSDAVQSFDPRAVINCENLAQISTSNDNPYYKSIEGVLYSKDGQTLVKYPMGKKGNNFTIPDGVIAVGEHAFRDAKLSSITIPNTVTTIKFCAFSGCKDFQTLLIPNSVTEISGSAFSECEKLDNVTMSTEVSKIESHTFSSCTNIQKFTIGSKVDFISYDAFRGCSSLKEFEVDEDNNNFMSQSGIIYTKNMEEVVMCPSAFNTETYSILNGVKVIQKYAFYECTNIKEINLPETLTTIRQNAFEGCSLTSITIPQSVTSIGYLAFEGCQNLKAFAFPDGITDIESAVLSRCRSLQNVYIPESVNSFGYNVFSDCDELSLIDCRIKDIDKVSESSSFDDIPSDCTWRVPAGDSNNPNKYADLYKAQSWWVNTWKIEIDENSTDIGCTISDGNSISWNNGILEVKAKSKDNIRIYSINGQLVHNISANNGDVFRIELPSGMYIINNKKVLFK